MVYLVLPKNTILSFDRSETHRSS